MENIIECISYARFSSAEQSEGRSIARQGALVDKYMQSHPECSLTSQIADEGFSGYHGKHVSQGSLGRLLELVRNGSIKKGTRLLIEQPDRLSRQETLDSMGLVSDLLNEGLDIVTLDDGKHYSRELMRDDPMSHIWLHMRLVRAYEESKVKSERAKDVWNAKRKQIRDGKLPAMRVPWWIQNPERQEDVRLMFALALEGNGSHAIAKQLNDRGIKSPSGRGSWYTANVSSLLRDTKVTGYYQDPQDMTMYKIFPEVIKQSTFNDVQVMIKSRYRTEGMGMKWTSVLKQIAFCGTCGETLKPTKSGSGRTLYCRSSWVGACPNKRGMTYRSVVLGVIAVMQEDMAQMSAQATERADSGEVKAKLQAELEHTQKSIEALSEALAELDDMPEVIAQLKIWKDKRAAISQQLASHIDEPVQNWFEQYADMFYNEIPDKVGGHLMDNEIHQDINVLLCKLGVRVEVMDGKAHVYAPSGLEYVIEYVSWKQTRVSLFTDGETHEVGLICKDVGEGTQYVGGNFWYLRSE